MEKKYMLIGYKEVPIQNADQSIGQYNHYVLGTLIGTTYNINYAEELAAGEIQNFELGIEIKTIFGKD